MPRASTLGLRTVFTSLPMKRKRAKQNADFKLKVKYVFTPDCDQRLRRAIDILLESAGRHAAPPEDGIDVRKDESSAQDPDEDRFSSGDGRSD